jgi:hypothetical protein
MLCRRDASAWELITFAEVSELGPAYNLHSGRVTGQKVGASSFPGCGGLGALPVPGNLEGSETDAELR